MEQTKRDSEYRRIFLVNQCVLDVLKLWLDTSNINFIKQDSTLELNHGESPVLMAELL